MHVVGVTSLATGVVVMDDLIWHSLQGNTGEDEECLLAQWRAASASNERHYRELRALWQASSLMERPRPATRRPSTAEILDAANGRGADGWIRGAGRFVGPRWLAAGVATAAAVILALGALQIFQGPRLQAQEFVTGSGETASVRLADGSVVRLGPESRLRLPGTRIGDVWLDGTAFFAIAKQDGRSFTVQTSAGTATVLGTRFELQTRERELRLVVVEGSVAVQSHGERVDVGAGEVSYVVEGAAPSVARVDDPRAMLGWMEGVLVFQDTPLSRVVHEIEAEYGTHITIADAVLAQRVVTAFFVDQPVEAVVSVVCQVVAARCSLGVDSAMMKLPER